jgi:hypothetical protein
MNDADVADFGELAWTGYRIVLGALPRNSTQRELKTQKFEKSRRRQSADNITATAHAND